VSDQAHTLCMGLFTVAMARNNANKNLSRLNSAHFPLIVRRKQPGQLTISTSVFNFSYRPEGNNSNNHRNHNNREVNIVSTYLTQLTGE